MIIKLSCPAFHGQSIRRQFDRLVLHARLIIQNARKGVKTALSFLSSSPSLQNVYLYLL